MYTIFFCINIHFHFNISFQFDFWPIISSAEVAPSGLGTVQYDAICLKWLSKRQTVLSHWNRLAGQWRPFGNRVGQETSSEASWQSLSPSHTNSMSIQWLLRQRNWSSRHSRYSVSSNHQYWVTPDTV